MEQRGNYMKIFFDYFQIQKWMLQTVRAEKVDKKWSYLSSFHVSFLRYGPWIVQNVHFLQLCADLSKKPKSVKAIWIYTSESSPYTLLENDMVCRGLSHLSLDIKNDAQEKLRKNLTKFFDFKP